MKETHLQSLLHQLSHMSIQHTMHLLGEFKLKPNQAGILFIISRHAGISQKELADKMDLTPPSVTAAIQKLEHLGYIIRETDEKDQRMIRLEVTDKAKGCMAKIETVLEQVETVLLDNMSVEEKLLIRRLLYQMRDNLTACKGMKRNRLCPSILEH